MFNNPVWKKEKNSWNKYCQKIIKKQNKKLIAVTMVGSDNHYRYILQYYLHNDIVVEGCRGFGIDFIIYSNKQLANVYWKSIHEIDDWIEYVTEIIKHFLRQPFVKYLFFGVYLILLNSNYYCSLHIYDDYNLIHDLNSHYYCLCYC